jgi:hypothetical protein
LFTLKARNVRVVALRFPKNIFIHLFFHINFDTISAISVLWTPHVQLCSSTDCSTCEVHVGFGGIFVKPMSVTHAYVLPAVRKQKVLNDVPVETRPQPRTALWWGFLSFRRRGTRTRTRCSFFRRCGRSCNSINWSVIARNLPVNVVANPSHRWTLRPIDCVFTTRKRSSNDVGGCWYRRRVSFDPTDNGKIVKRAVPGGTYPRAVQRMSWWFWQNVLLSLQPLSTVPVVYESIGLSIFRNTTWSTNW